MQRKRIRLLYFLLFTFYFLIFLSSCSISKQIGKQANAILINDSAVRTGHIGISIYEPATGKYWYNYNADKYFIPASNTKLFTLYAGLKYLGDSLTGLSYQNLSDTTINVAGTGDPTFLHPGFKNQPVLNFLKAQQKTIYLSGNYKDNALGYGWAWDDYNEYYMVERNAFPIYGNTINIRTDGYHFSEQKVSYPKWKITPGFFNNAIDSQFVPGYFTTTTTKDSAIAKQKMQSFTINRERISNKLHLKQASSIFTSANIPFVTNGEKTAVQILKDDFNLSVINGIIVANSSNPDFLNYTRWSKLKTQPTDSLLKPMMYRSDNFFAEQALIMASNEYLGYMSSEKMIDTMLTTSLGDLPQKPKWVDGSGLSRYNLCTPQSLVYLLNKIRNEFGWDRITGILPTGGTGTLGSWYKNAAAYIYAKTGTLSNNCALSGYLVTQKGKLLIFSVLNNNYMAGVTPVRRAVEQFLLAIREKY